MAVSILLPIRGKAFCGAFQAILLGFACSFFLLSIAASAEEKKPPIKATQVDPATIATQKAVPAADAPVPATESKKAAPVEKEKDAGKDKTPDKEKIPEPVELNLTTSDGVLLALTYYPSNHGREAIPIVLLHMSKGSRTDYKYLAVELQKQGFAVIAPDLRGHGDSTKQKIGDTDRTLNAAKLPIDQYLLMVDRDMYAVKEFLWEKNNAKELNLNKLCLIGAEMGASVAINFTAFDSMGYGDSDRGPFYGPLQLGLFVKGLILLSPEVSFKGLPLTPLHEDLRKNLPVLILVGRDDSKSYGDAERVSKIFKRTPPKKPEDTTYFFNTLNTKLQGTHLLEPKTLNTDKMISQFLQLRLVQSEDAKNWTWKKLKKPHE
jgi:pimeloyl-ACP methyl ester carboxylesterase